MRRKHNIPEPLWRSMTLAKRVDEAWAEYCTVRDRLTGLLAPVGGDRVSSTPNHDKFAALPICYEKWDKYRRQYARAVEEAKEIIEQIDDPRYRRVLTCRYIEALSPQDTAKAMHYSADRERHLHTEALEAFWGIWQSR